MSNTSDSNKVHGRLDYKPFKVACRICLGIGKRKSKSFSSPYALKHHLTIAHDMEDEIHSGVTRAEILKTVRAITIALEWKMLIDLSQRN